MPILIINIVRPTILFYTNIVIKKKKSRLRSIDGNFLILNFSINNYTITIFNITITINKNSNNNISTR